MATYSDNFNRADGTLGAPWAAVVSDGVAIVSNAIKRNTTSGSYGVASVTGETFDNDQDAAATITAVNVSDFAGVGVRFDGSGNGYLMVCQFADGRVYLYRFDAGVQANLGFISSTPVVTDQIKLGVVGTTFTYYLNGVSQGTWSDATYSSGSPAVGFINGGSNSTTLDDFTAEGLAAITPALTSVDSDDTVRVGDSEPIVYANFTTPIETATINDGGTAVTNLSVSSITATAANIQLANMAAWVNTKACPFTDTNNTTQQVTITSTDEEPDEVASLAVTFSPASGLIVTPTNGFTWPAPDGSIIKGFASQPPANSQVIHPTGLSVSATGIVTTGLTTNQTCYFWNATTEEAGSFTWLIESASAPFATNAVRNSVKLAIRQSIRNSVR